MMTHTKSMPCLMAAAVIFSAAAGAQTYPNKAVRLLVPQGPGGGNDTIARMVGQKLTGTLKQQFAIDNRAGAGGLIAAELASKAPADGYTLFLGNVATLAIIPNAQKKTPYDPLKDFEPITLLASAPQVVAVHPSLPVKSMKDLITLAKAKPGMVNYASNGVGSSNHLATELFVMLSGVKLTHVPYKGLAPALTDVLSGEVPLIFSSTVAMMPHVKTGRLRAIGITSAKRSPTIPEIPTVAEATGLKDYEAGSWYGLVAPAGTPRAIIDLLNREAVAAMKSPDVIERLSFEGVLPVANSPEEFSAYIKKEHARIGKVIRAADVKLD